MIPEQKIKVCITNRNRKFYQELGYEVKDKQYIYVCYQDLPPTSLALVKVKCDICGEEFLRDKRHINKSRNLEDNLDYCKKCAISSKRVKTCIRNFGVEYPMQSKEILNKSKETHLKHYGCERPSQSKEIREKIKNKCLEHYGCENPSQSEKVKDKKKETTMKHYGVEYCSQSEEIKNKTKNTNLRKYGCEYPMQSSLIREKAINSFVKNGTIHTSKQELELFELLKTMYPNVKHSYICNPFVFDILVEIDNIKIDVEYDGKYWHQDKRRDVIRDKVIQKQGFKTLRISAINTLPTKQQILEAINILVNTDKRYIHIDL